ncbi:MAG TPA: hypothetical protein VME46_20035, partial [Acidimicrobiales bacterium]|nr:hypothetical protein [Acidimicrobiales bacterium]
MRIAIDVEQLFYRAPGGTGRYTARLVASMAAQFSGDVVVPFCAWHGRDRMRLALARYDLGLEAVPPGRHGSGRRASATTPGEPATAAQLVRLPAPRVALLQGWHTARLGAGLARRLLGPATWSAELRRADLFHNPFPAAPPVPAPLVVTVHDAGPALHPGTYTRRGLRYHEKAL